MFDLQSYLKRTLGDNLLALLSNAEAAQLPAMPWFRPNGEWLAVVSDDVTTAQLHAAFRPIVSAQAPRPVVVRSAWVHSYKLSRPLNAHAWGQADVLLGANPFIEAAPPDAFSQAAFLAHRTLQTSRLLFDRALPQSERSRVAQELRALSEQLGIDSAETISPEQTLGAIHQTIAELYPFTLQSTPCDAGDASLLTVFEELDTLILVVSQPSITRLDGVNWATLPQIRQTRYRNIMVTTAAHLELIARHEMAIAFRTGQYRLQTGCDVVGHAHIGREDVLRRALRTVVTAATDQLSHAVWGTAEPRLRHGLHAVQNTLLKIQLQYEVLCLLNDVESKDMIAWPTLTAGVPTNERLEAIESVVATWRDLYERLLEETLEVSGRQNGRVP